MRSRIFAISLTVLTAVTVGFSIVTIAQDSRPIPRWPNGRIRLSAVPGQKGLWGGSGRLAINPGSYEPRTTLNAPIHIDAVPLQPWARALVDYRHINFLKDEPYARCKASPGPRQWTTAYGFEILDDPELQRIYILNVGGPHSFQTIYMDGRSHPSDLTPNYYGHAVGRWDGDTLVIDSTGFNERAWMNRDAFPHTDRLHLTERLTRTSYNTLKYEVTIDDPGAYTATWTSGFNMQWTDDSELFEYICQDNNLGAQLMVGADTTVDRSSIIVP